MAARFHRDFLVGIRGRCWFTLPRTRSSHLGSRVQLGSAEARPPLSSGQCPPQMLGFLPLTALAAADHADLVSGNLCVSRHRLVQDEWCQFNCNSARPNCPADTCTCEGSLSFAGSSSRKAHDQKAAEKAAPSHGNRALHNSSLGDSSSVNSSLANSPLRNSSLANSSASESSTPEVLRQADGKQVESLTTDGKKEWHSKSGRRNAGTNGKLVLFGSNDGTLPSLASQIVEKFYNLCKKAHGSDCSLAQIAQISSEQLLHASEQLLLDNSSYSTDDAVSVGSILDGVLTPIPQSDV